MIKICVKDPNKGIKVGDKDEDGYAPVYIDGEKIHSKVRVHPEGFHKKLKNLKNR